MQRVEIHPGTGHRNGAGPETQEETPTVDTDKWSIIAAGVCVVAIIAVLLLAAIGVTQLLGVGCG